MGRVPSKRGSLPTYVQWYVIAIETTGRTTKGVPRVNGGLIASYARNLTVSRLRLMSDVAKYATDRSSRLIPSNQNYVRNTMFQLPILSEYPESVSLKCTGCKGVHEHTTTKVVPVADEDPSSILDLLKLSKRLTCCSNCGLLKLIN